MTKDNNDELFLLSLIPDEQKKRVFGQKYCDIDDEFLGFINVYKYLSEIIPIHFTVIDLGCAYNPQCFYFTKHKKYIAVDSMDIIRFCSDNCELVSKTIEDYIKSDIGELNIDETFAICSYVPPWGGDNIKMVRESFKNVFTFYPHGEQINVFKT